MLFISPVNAVLIPFDPAGASQPLNVQGINTHRHVRHPFNDRVLQFLRRFIRSIMDGPQEGLSVEKKGKGKNRKAGFPSLQLQTPASASGCRARSKGWGRKYRAHLWIRLKQHILVFGLGAELPIFIIDFDQRNPRISLIQKINEGKMPMNFSILLMLSRYTGSFLSISGLAYILEPSKKSVKV